jgi:bifunctional DNA-binding transcriptional regulator/antitoxin component of YhaV-PrlF toxin-antitoxin module
MTIAQSRLTAQSQISVPVEVRKKLGVGPGSILEWYEQNNAVFVRRAGRFSSVDVHQVLFPNGAKKTESAPDVKAGIRKRIRQRYARS